MHPLLTSLTTAILILALLSAGCTDTSGSSVQNPTTTETPNLIDNVNASKAPEVDPNVVNVDNPVLLNEHPIYPNFKLHTLSPDETLFDKDIMCYIDGPAYKNGIYDGIDVNGKIIFTHKEITSFDPYKDLQPDQARALEAEYGSAKLVVIEQIDTDGDGALDTVAVRCEGSKTWTFESAYHAGWGVEDYIYMELIK